MKNILFFLITFLLICIDAYSIDILGKVYDSVTKLPIANASIFLKGTSYSTKTNGSGAFYLKVAKGMNTSLIVSHLSYEILEIDNPFENESMEIFLNERDYSLNEITISPGRFSRDKLFNAFEQQFLGNDKAGKSSIREQDDIQDIPSRLVSLFEKQLEVFPQEKIYVHTDKPYYISGEKIWFRAFLADAKSHEPVPVSRYVYVELFNSIDSLITRVKIRQEEGSYHGYLPVPEDTREGYYTIRAYTFFMQNQDENYLFTKSLYIGDPQAKTTNHVSTFDSDFDVSFCPEGGSLMLGTFCKIAFKAIKSDGLAADVSGTIYDQSGKEIREFESEHSGMGSFPFLAEKGKSYYAVCKNNDGKSKRFDLPAAVDYGYALSVTGMKDKIYVNVLKTAFV